MLLGDWSITTLDTWQSGALLAVTRIEQLHRQLSGYRLYAGRSAFPACRCILLNINCGCIDPTKQTILNPAAWQNQAAGVPGSNIIYYNDFRAQRRPVISGGLGKRFRVRERASFNIRAEFFNLLNQDLSLANPSTSSPRNPPTHSNGLLTGGFGYLNYTGISANSVSSSIPTPRTGQIVARIPVLNLLGRGESLPVRQLAFVAFVLIVLRRCAGPAATPPSIRFEEIAAKSGLRFEVAQRRVRPVPSDRTDRRWRCGSRLQQRRLHGHFFHQRRGNSQPPQNRPRIL